MKLALTASGYGTLAVWLTCAVANAVVPQQLEFPYNALVVKDQAAVYSGPGEVHYSTDELPSGASVEVYRHDPGGWCAIRPPAGSFSLIPQSAVEPVSSGIGRLVDDGFDAWVGTRTGAVTQPLRQVKLRKGELVEILDEISWPNENGGSANWYQIAPPAGEFRWIRIDDIEATDEPANALNPSATNRAVQRIRSDIENRQTGEENRQASLTEDSILDDLLDPPSSRNESINRGWRQARSPIRVAQNDGPAVAVNEPFKIPAVTSPAKSATPFGDSLPPMDAQTKPIGTLTDPKQSIDATSIADLAPIDGPVSPRIRSLDSALTAEILKTPEEWDLEPLLRQATLLSTETVDSNERQLAVRLIQKIRNCVAVQSKYQSAYKPNGLVGNLSAAVGTGVAESVPPGTIYDAYGWLNQLVRDKGKGEPTFVLEDDQGRIVYHIAPAPGLNLNRYLKSQVGVIGRRGYHRELNLDHITAERIVVLDKALR